MIANRGHRYTISEFEAFVGQPENQERRFELIDGEIVERMRTEESGVIRAEFAMWVGTFVEERKLGRVVLPAYHHAANDDYNDLLPDVSFTRKERLLPIVAEGAVPQIPDLVIEIPSRDDKVRDFRSKVQYYLANGAQMVWLANLVSHEITVYTRNTPMVYTENDTLDGGDLLSGFTLPVRDIFDIE